MKKTLSVILSLVMVFSIIAMIPFTATATELTGDGSADNPYLISDYAELKAFAEKVNLGQYDACAKLKNDIICKNDPNDTEYAKDWVPIGEKSSKAYKGTFDGQGHSIIGLSNQDISSAPDLAGLFGSVGSNGKIKNLSIKEANLKAKSRVGAVAGENSGTISYCANYSDMNVSSGANEVGGIVGYNNGGATITCCFNSGNITCSAENVYLGGIAGGNVSSTIENCYNAGDINATGTDMVQVGGITGENIYTNVKIENCYNVGGITGDASNTELVGALVGYNISLYGGEIKNSYYDYEYSLAYEASGIGYSDETVKSSYYRYYSGDNVIGTENDQMNFTDPSVWLLKANDGICYYYPHLKGFNLDGEGNQKDATNINRNDWPAAKYVNDLVYISNYAELKEFADMVNNQNKTNYSAIITDDIVCDDSAWIPIGQSNRFNGSIAGDGHTIKGLNNSDNPSDHAGFVGNFGGTTIENLGIIDATIVGYNYVGGIAGEKRGIFRNCYFTGSVSGTGSNVGGLAGRNGGLMERCYNKGSVTLTNNNNNTMCYFGGIAGYNSGTIRLCYNAGNITVISDANPYIRIGGINGSNEGGTVERCYNTGTITDMVYAELGGIVGNNAYGATVRNCYNVGDIYADNYSVAGIVGRNNSTVENCYNAGIVFGDHVHVGGVVSENYSGTVRNCFSDNTRGYVEGYDDDRGLYGAVPRVTEGENCENVSGLIPGLMTGTEALSSMTFSDPSVWLVKADCKDGDSLTMFYPQLKGFDFDEKGNQLSAEQISADNWPAKTKAKVYNWLGSDEYTYNRSAQGQRALVAVGGFDIPQGKPYEINWLYGMEPGQISDNIGSFQYSPTNYTRFYRVLIKEDGTVVETKYCAFLREQDTPVKYKVLTESGDYQDIDSPVNAGTYKAYFSFGAGHIPVAEKTFVIKPVSDEVVLTVAGNTDSKEYNASEHNVTGYSYSAVRGDNSVPNDEFNVTLNAGSEAIAKGTDAGTYYMGLTKNDFTVTSHNYSNVTVECDDGSIEITPKAVTVTAQDKTFTYDGTAHSWSGFDVDGLFGSDKINAVVTGSITFPSESPVENKIESYSFTTGKASNYDVTTVSGQLTMTNTSVDITITAASDSWTYDGKTHKNNNVTVTSGNLFTGDELVATASGSVKDVSDTATGNNPVKSGYKIMHGDKDVTSSYNITTVAGTLTVNRANITVRADNKSRRFDEDEPELTATVIGLAEGDDESLITYTIGRDSGDDVNTYTITPSGDAVQGNYNVAYETGSFQITKANLPTLTDAQKPTANKIVGDDKAHELVTAPESLPDGYTSIEYSLGNDSWSTDIPTVTDVGDYSVQVRYIADGNHESFIGSNIPVRIKDTYTVTWLDDDGTEFAKKTFVEDEDEPTVTDTPEKKADKQYTYTFDKWVKDDSSTVSNIVYNPTFSSTVNKYKIEFVNEDGTVLQSKEVEYGTVPTYNGETPTKKATAKYSYTFNGWDTEIEAVTGKTMYTATYTEAINEYEISFVNFDGSVLQTSTVTYGETPEYTGKTPTRDADDKYTYEFNDWDSEINEVTGEKIYTATFTATEIPVYSADSDTVEWTIGDNALIITIHRSYDDDKCFAHFVKVLINGKEVEVKAKSGSTIITIDPETLESLGAGAHTVTVIFDDGEYEMQLEICNADEPETAPEVVEIPKTGTEADVRIMVWLYSLSVFGIYCAGIFYTKKRNTKEEQE